MNLMPGSFCELAIMRKSCPSEWSNQRATIIDALNVLVHLQGDQQACPGARFVIGLALTVDGAYTAR